MHGGKLNRSVRILCSVFILLTGIIFSKVYAEAENFVSNGTFTENVKDWATYHESGGACSLAGEDGRLALTIQNVGRVNYAVQLYYDKIPLQKNAVYRVTFEIAATTDRPIEFRIQKNGGDYRAYTDRIVDLTGEPQTIDYEFTMEEETDIMARLALNCGTFGNELETHTIYLDNISVVLVDDSKAGGNEKEEDKLMDIMVNQIGYRSGSVKTAVFSGAENVTKFSVISAETGEIVYEGTLSESGYSEISGSDQKTGDFTGLTKEGTYYISCEGLENSFPFTISDKVFDKVLSDSVRMLYLQRCGTEVVDEHFGHAACHTGLAVVYGTDEKRDVSGGWHDAGDYGRYTVPAAKAAADLLYAYLNASSLFGGGTGIPESGNGIPDILDEVRYELEWMLKMQDPDGGVHHKVTAESFPGFVMPEYETEQLILTPVSTTATADLAGTMALAYEVYKGIDPEFAEACLKAAELAWEFLEAHPEFIFTNPADIVTGAYDDTSDTDERFWAAAQLWRATGGEKYLSVLGSMQVSTGMGWADMGDYGNIAVLTMEGIDKDSDIYRRAEKAILETADKYVRIAESTPYGVSVDEFVWGSNMSAANAGVLCGIAYRLTGQKQYLDAVISNLDYLMGRNPLGICYVTGWGTVSPQHPHHRPSAAMGMPVSGMLVGGPDPRLEDPTAQAYCEGKPDGMCYIDNLESYSTNEITIYWNSPLTWLLTFTK